MEKTPVRIVESFHNIHDKGLQQEEQREESPLRPSSEGSLQLVMRKAARSGKTEKEQPM